MDNYSYSYKDEDLYSSDYDKYYDEIFLTNVRSVGGGGGGGKKPFHSGKGTRAKIANIEKADTHRSVSLKKK
jgi:hypothetical protein